MAQRWPRAAGSLLPPLFLWQASAVSLTSSSTVPPGWYPDPGGARQWRVWTGSTWSELTRPYGPATAPAAAPATPGVASSLALIDGLNRLVRYGTLALFTG